uniref:ADP,ATP carrier protein n=1 Tax=Amorphochlora amoebiformis TaxID=1561963 RepID=A0A7S0GYI5_9EUKA
MMKSRLGMSASEESIGLKYIFCSGTAAAIGVLLTNPLDVIRVRSMVDGEGGLGGKAFRYKGVIHAFNDIIRKEGVRALGKGLKARILWYVANDAIGMTAYEKFKHWFGVSRGKFDGGNSGYC